MSNNACRLLFRVGETHWIIQGQDSLSFERLHGGSDVCESLISMQEPSVIPELTLAVTAAATQVAQKVAGTRVLPVSAGLLHTVRVRRKDNRELAAPRLSSPSVCLQYTMCHAAPGWCQRIKNPADYSFTMSYSAFHPRYVSVLVHLPCQLLLSGFLKM